LDEGRTVTVRFDDVDGRFFDRWEQQPENGRDFVVSREDSRTLVELESAKVVLDRVELLPCEARYTQVTLRGPDTMWLHTNVDQLMGEVGGAAWSGDCRQRDAPPEPSPRP
jgi:hypothetical protein